MREHRRRLGRNDTTKIPLAVIAEVHINRRIGRSDIVRLTTTTGYRYEWKIGGGAEKLVNLLAEKTLGGESGG